VLDAFFSEVKGRRGLDLRLAGGDTRYLLNCLCWQSSWMAETTIVAANAKRLTAKVSSPAGLKGMLITFYKLE